MIARKRPKRRLIRARLFVLCLGLVAILVLFVFLDSGFPYALSTAIWFPGLIMLTAVIALLMLPVVWKALDEDLAQYRLARWQVIRGWKFVPFVGPGLAVIIAMSIVALWYSNGRSRSEVLQQLALPFVVALAAYDLVSFWIVDRKAMRYVVSQTRFRKPPEDD